MMKGWRERPCTRQTVAGTSTIGAACGNGIAASNRVGRCAQASAASGSLVNNRRHGGRLHASRRAVCTAETRRRGRQTAHHDLTVSPVTRDAARHASPPACASRPATRAATQHQTSDHGGPGWKRHRCSRLRAGSPWRGGGPRGRGGRLRRGCDRLALITPPTHRVHRQGRSTRHAPARLSPVVGPRPRFLLAQQLTTEIYAGIKTGRKRGWTHSNRP